MFHWFESKDEKKARLQKKLMLAVFNEDLKAVKRLIKQGAPVSAQDEDGWTALHMASYEGVLEIAQCLIEAGAQVNIKNKNDNTPLHMAVSERNLEVFEALIKAGADVTLETKEGDTALHMVAGYGCLYLAKSLVEAGADILKKNKRGEDAYSLAAPREINDIKTWIREYIPLKLLDKEHVTALQVAASRGNLMLAQDLIKEGADLLAKNNEGQDAYQIAMKNGHIKIAKMIKEAIKEKMKMMALKKVTPSAFSSLMKASMQKERE